MSGVGGGGEAADAAKSRGSVTRAAGERPEVRDSMRSRTQARPHVVVVGSGVAGLVTALGLVARCDVTVVTKGAIDESNTRYAQGGIAAAVMTGDSVASHVADTLAAGAGLSDPRAVEALCAEGPERIRDLIAWGLEFDRLGGDPAAPFDTGLEGAHSFNRILHAGGDATGFEVERTLVAAVRAAGIRVIESAFVVDLMQDAEGRARGLLVKQGGRLETIAADAVVLASGGIGQLFAQTTNPSVATGDGAAVAWRAGAVLADVELVQFHPTALAVPGSFLVSEAVRGDGAVLRNAAGERFMAGVHPLAELAPRDVVARAIAAEMLRTGAPVFLDATALGAEELERRFPTISAACRANGFDWATTPVPVAPAAHYWMGGVATDLDGRTSVPGLWAVGEVACTGVHGANRLASNSLLESLVFAHRCAMALTRALPLAAAAAAAESRSFGRVAPLGDPEVRDSMADPTRSDLQELMGRAAGVYRSAEGLREARETLAGWRIDVGDPASATLERLETANLLQLARVLVESALTREESRGAHFRADFPAAGPAFEGHLVVDRAHPSPALVPEIAPFVAGFAAEPSMLQRRGARAAAGAERRHDVDSPDTITTREQVAV